MRKKDPTPTPEKKITESSTCIPASKRVRSSVQTVIRSDENSSCHSATDECRNAETDTRQRISSFPVDVLPARLQRIIKEANPTLGFPVDYLAGAILAALSAAIGNTHKAEIMTGWKEYAILFTAIVGTPGTNKSHPLSFAMQSLIDFDAEQAGLYAEALKRYNAAMELPPKERTANGYEQNLTEPKRADAEDREESGSRPQCPPYVRWRGTTQTCR